MISPANVAVLAAPPRLLRETTKQGVSDNLSNMLAAARRHLEAPISWAKGPVIAQLAEIVNECMVANWDGDGAKPVSAATVNEAELLIRLLPYDVALPHLSVTPSGAISFEWIKDASDRLMLTVSGVRRINYATLNGQEHGSPQFVENIPDRIDQLISRYKAIG